MLEYPFDPPTNTGRADAGFSESIESCRNSSCPSMDCRPWRRSISMPIVSGKYVGRERARLSEYSISTTDHSNLFRSTNPLAGSPGCLRWMWLHNVSECIPDWIVPSVRTGGLDRWLSNLTLTNRLGFHCSRVNKVPVSFQRTRSAG